MTSQSLPSWPLGLGAPSTATQSYLVSDWHLRLPNKASKGRSNGTIHGDDCIYDCNSKGASSIQAGHLRTLQGQTSARFRAISQHDTRCPVTYIYELWCARGETTSTSQIFPRATSRSAGESLILPAMLEHLEHRFGSLRRL